MIVIHREVQLIILKKKTFDRYFSIPLQTSENAVNDEL